MAAHDYGQWIDQVYTRLCTYKTVVSVRVGVLSQPDAYALRCCFTVHRNQPVATQVV